MLPNRLRYALLLAIALFFILVLSLLKRKRLALKYTLLWLFTAVALLILAIFPEILFIVAGWVGIQTGMNTLYVFLIAFIMMILMSLTSIVSVQTERIRKLAEANAILEQRVRHLESVRSEGMSADGITDETDTD